LLWNRNWNLFPGGGAAAGRAVGAVPQRPPAWRRPQRDGRRTAAAADVAAFAGDGQTPAVTDATADAPWPPQRPQESKHFSTSSSRPGPPPRDVAANAAAPQRALPPPRPRHASTAAAAGHAHARGQARARRTAPTGREWTAGGRAWRRGRRVTAGGGLSTRRSRSLLPFLLSPCPPTSLPLAAPLLPSVFFSLASILTRTIGTRLYFSTCRRALAYQEARPLSPARTDRKGTPRHEAWGGHPPRRRVHGQVRWWQGRRFTGLSFVPTACISALHLYPRFGQRVADPGAAYGPNCSC